MANFDQLSCTTTGSPGNTGFDPNCYLDIQQIIWAALVPSSMVIPKQYLTPTAIIPYLTSLARNDDPAQRIYPIGNLTLETAGGGDRREYTDNYGNKLTTGENPYEWTFQYTKGGAQLQASLRKFNTNGQWNLIVADKSNIYMANNGDGTASGYTTNTTWSLPIVLNTGQDPTLYRFYVGKVTDDFNDNRYTQNYTGNIANIKGLQTITLINSSFNPTTGVANVQVLANGKNVYTSYKNVLNAPALWKAFNTVTGGIIGILTVTANDGFNGFAVALDPTDPDYPADLGGSSISLVVPSALAAANIVGFENSAPLVEAPDVALQSNAASSGAITKNTTNNVLYVGKLSSGINETPSAIASTITGTFVAGDATNFKLYASATGVLDGTQTLIATVAATGLASGAVPSFANTASYPAGTKYFILTTDVPNAAVSGHTFIASKLAYTGLAGTVYDTQAATGGTKTVS